MRYLLFLFALLVWVSPVMAQPTINISGGGAGKLRAAIDANTTTGANLVIQDSLTYTETQDLPIGPRNGAVIGRRAFNITALAGQSPTVDLNGCGLLAYSGGADCRFGSNAGGRITLDVSDAAIAGGGNLGFWYIGQENGATGRACQVLFENVNIIGGNANPVFTFGAGGNDGSPVTTSASLTIRNVKIDGGFSHVRTLYGPAAYRSTVNIENSQLLNFKASADANSIVPGAFGLGGPFSVVNITNSVIYNEDSPLVATESNSILHVLGRLNITNSDIINLSQSSVASRAVTFSLISGVVNITNSIVYGSEGLLNAGSGSANITTSNVDGYVARETGPNINYAGSIAEWPVYNALGTDLTVEDNLRVGIPTQSYVIGSAPIGSRGAGSEKVFPISGGGTDKMAAITNDFPTSKGTILITDSGSYSEAGGVDRHLRVAPRYSATDGRRSFNIVATTGTAPTIVMTNGGILAYSGGRDAQIGSNLGGRISIDMRNGGIGGTAGAIWYIGQENAIGTPGRACQLKFENVNLDFRTRSEGIVFGAGGNDGSPVLTSASLTLNNVYTRGGGAIVQTLYGPATYPSFTSILNSQLLELESANGNATALHLGAFQLGGVNTKGLVSRTTIHMPDTGTLGFDANGLIARKGKLTVDHVNVINLTTVPNVSASRGILATEDGITSVTNSIIHAQAGVVLLAATTGAGSATDSNVFSPAGVPNAGFSFTNVISEWPVFEAVNGNPSDADNFLVTFGTQSATLGTTPPIGARDEVSAPPPSSARQWNLFM